MFSRAAAVSRCCRTFRMPLRAKLPAPVIGAPRAHMSIETIREKKGDAIEDVLFDSLYGLRTIELNNQPKLNPLDASMIRKIAPRLREWGRSDLANVVVIKGAGPKAMCAGGDVMTLATQNLEGAEGMKQSAEYFALEYCLDHYIATYNKPYIAFMDGITMGGGVGLSVHAPFRIATERTVFAMPETNIGFFPDVGATFFLPRMPGELGTYLALTSDRITGSNVFYTGIATHYLHSAQLPALEQRLAELRFHDYETHKQRLDLINHTIEEFATGMPWDEKFIWGGNMRKMIDQCFKHNTVPEILAALAEIKTQQPESAGWADRTIATIRQRSPTAVTIALRQLRLGKEWTISQVFSKEYQLAAKFMAHPDFTEGVISLLGKPRRQPQWQPATLEDIEDPDTFMQNFFLDQPLLPQPGDDAPTHAPAVGDLKLWTNQDYPNYPHRFGVPTEYDVFRAITGAKRTPNQVLVEVSKRWRGKQGIQPVVKDILNRRAMVNRETKICAWEPTEHELVRLRDDEADRLAEVQAKKAVQAEAKQVADERARNARGGRR